MSYSSSYAPLHDLAWHIQVEFTASVNMILVHIRMLVQCINMEAGHREQIDKGCQGTGLHLGLRSAHWRAQYEHEIWCVGASTYGVCEYLCVTTPE